MEEKTKDTKNLACEQKFAVILIRGLVNVKTEIRDTLSMLGLYIKNNCVIIPKNPNYEGMLKKAKDYITWGEIDAETENKLKTMKIIKEKTYRLHPPVKGFERKGIKKSFKEGGVLGYRGKEMIKLVEKMSC